MNYEELKPHHFLDILKLYGAGISEFVPDYNYNHDFYRVANLILNQPKTLIRLTLQKDAICLPCKFLRADKCVDVVNGARGYIKKYDWNWVIDVRLLNLLEVDEGYQTSAFELAHMFNKRLSADVFSRIWNERQADETKKRAELTLQGIDKYLNQAVV
jgi:hypothetical protein